MCAFQNGFHHEKCHNLFLKLGISTLGHQIQRLATILLKCSLWENVGKYGKIGRFSGWIWPDWGNTARADLAGFGSIWSS